MTKLKQIKITFIKTEITNETETSTVDAQEIQLYTDPNLPGTSNQELAYLTVRLIRCWSGTYPI